MAKSLAVVTLPEGGNTMSTEQLKVLEMVASGTLSVDEGNQLLNALAADRSSDARPRQARSVPRQENGRDVENGRLTPETLARLRNHGITAAYVKELRDAGFGNLSMEQLIKLGGAGVTGKYIQEM